MKSPASFISRFRQGISGRLDSALRRRSDPAPPYCAEYLVPGSYSPPADSDKRRIAGLACWMVLPHHQQEGRRVLALWQNREHFEAYERDFRQSASLPGKPVASDYSSTFNLFSKPLWKRWTVLVAGAFAALGYVELARSHYSQYFGCGDAAFQFARPKAASAEIDVLAGRPASLTLQVQNRSRDLTASVHVGSVWIELPGAGETLDLVPEWSGTVGPLQSGQSASLRLELGEPPPPGYYTIRLSAEIENGSVLEFLGWRGSGVHEDRVRVWPRYADQPIDVRPIDESGAWLLRLASVGKHAPYGLGCQAEITGDHGARILSVDFDAGQHSQLRTDHGALDWKTGPIPSFSDVYFRLNVEASEGTNWDKLNAATTVVCNTLLQESGP